MRYHSSLQIKYELGLKLSLNIQFQVFILFPESLFSKHGILKKSLKYVVKGDQKHATKCENWDGIILMKIILFYHCYSEEKLKGHKINPFFAKIEQ